MGTFLLESVKIQGFSFDFDLKRPETLKTAHFLMKPTHISEGTNKTMDFHPLLKIHNKRQELLRHLLITLPGRVTKRPVTVSELSRRMDISRNAVSRLLNTDPEKLPMSEQMAVRCFLLTKDIQDDKPFELDDWLDIDLYYRREETETRVHDFIHEYEPNVKAFIAPKVTIKCKITDMKKENLEYLKHS